MAFPLETMHLIAHLRASHLALAEDADYANRIIKPMRIEKNEGKEQLMFERLEVSQSPPISFDIARHVQKSVKNNTPQYRGKNNSRKKTPTSPKKKPKKKIIHELPKIDIKNVKEELPSDNSTLNSQFLNEDNKNEVAFYDDDSESILSDKRPIELNYTKTIRGKNRLSKPKFPKFFNHKQNQDKDYHDSDSSASLETQKSGERVLNAIIEENSEKDEKDTSDAITIDSDFGVPVTVTGEIVKNPVVYKQNIDSKYEDNSNIPDRNTELSKDSISMNKDLYSEDEEDEEDEDEEDYDEISSSDSAFTDIETDSILNSSILLDSYENNTPSFSFGKSESLSSFKADSKKLRRKKRQNSFDNPSLSKTLSSSNLKGQNSHNLNNLNNSNVQRSVSGPGQSEINQRKQLPTPKKSQLDFTKVTSSALRQPKKSVSHLSDMIHSKFKTSGNNPLSYYAFAYNNDISKDKVIKLDIFVPPARDSLIKGLEINNNIAIVDCIGYILLNISKVPDFRSQIENLSFLNPNHWRLELVDEDGENYGSFGILERSRLLSSYNNLKEVALCKIDDANEIKKNEIQSPLSLEFKKELLNLEERQKKLCIINNDSLLSINDCKKDKGYELTVFIHPLTDSSNVEIIKHYADAHTTAIKLIQNICSQHGLDPNKYKLRQSQRIDNHNGLANKNLKRDNSLLQGNLLNTPSSSVHEKQSRSLRDNDNLKNIYGETFELIPVTDKKLGGLDSVISENSVLNDIITPSDFTFASPFISPSKKQIEEKFQSLSINSDNNNIEDSKNLPEKPVSQNKKKNDSEKYLNDMMLGKNLQLPTNLNTIYFKWKVWRKKNTILNKIEKSLIIDGDYIHLTPPDDIAFKTNLDHAFPSESHNHHHHHHLYYYNYNNYYKESMMKTSSFHITQIAKLKQYKSSKNPNHFKILITKQIDNPTNSKDNTIRKKYDLEACSSNECQEIIDKLKWVLKVYRSNLY